MSRGLLRSTSEICADCSAPDPCWASVNRGVLVCDECCSVHRSLGRHISQIKSLKKGSWSSTQLAMVHQLVSMGANNIWEHSLLDPSQNKHGRRSKPNPRDPVHPTKADFIRAKYQFLAFINKQRDTEVTSTDDLSKQLHSSVRTNNLETSLRLLSSGADPNFFSQEKGNSALHVAAQCGQSLQCELLVVYGADPGAHDVNRKSPVHYARTENHIDLGDRLLECQFELTDRLAFYLCSRKPDHRNDQHFIIPEMADSSLDLSELAKAAKKKLQALSNYLFEELAMDVYDEVDRRENENIWLATHNQSALVSDRQTVPFLPVNPEFSSTRNQGRQKLARFNAREFATLVIDILSDARRRQLGVTTTPSMKLNPERSFFSSSRDSRMDGKTISTISDDEPLYDSVASDEDYASIGDTQSLKEEQGLEVKQAQEELCDQKRSSSPASIVSFTESAISSQSDPCDQGPVSMDEYQTLKLSYTASQQQIRQLAQMNHDLKQEILMLQNMVQRLIQENQGLRSTEVAMTGTADNATRITNGHDTSLIRGSPRNNRPQSMFEPRERAPHWCKPSAQTSKDDTALPASQVSQGSSSSSLRSQTIPECLGTSDYDNANNNTDHDKMAESRRTSCSGGESDKSSRSSARSESSQATATDRSQTPVEGSGRSYGRGSMPDSASGEDLALPTQEDVVKRTEKITKKIQELLHLAQDDRHESYSGCAEKICSAVGDMTALFAPNIQDDRILGALRLLRSGSDKLLEQCRTPVVEGSTSCSPRQHTQQVIQWAYDIAKAAKQLVMMFE